MKNVAKTLMHQIMKDSSWKSRIQTAMLYGIQEKRITVRQAAQLQTLAGVQNASLEELYTLLSLFYETTKDKRFDPSVYYTEEEVQQYSNMVLHQTITLSQVIQMGEKEILTCLEWNDMLELLAAALKHREANELVKTFANRSEGGLAQTEKQIVDGMYYPDLVWINVSPEMYQRINNGKVVIPIEPPYYQLAVDFYFKQIVEAHLEDLSVIRNNPKRNARQKMLVPARVTTLDKGEFARNIRTRE